MTTDEGPEGTYPVFKGETFDLWQPDSGERYGHAPIDRTERRILSKRMRAPKGSAHREFGESYRGDFATLPNRRPRVAFRDSSRAGDTRTVRVALIPPDTFAAHQAQYFLFPRGDEKDEAFLLGTLCSIPLDWYARRVTESHVSFFVINPFPIPRPDRSNPLWQRTVALSGRLAAVDERYADWAEAVGVEYGDLSPDRKDAMIHELDAVVAHLYGLTREQLVHVFETFHEGWDHEPRLAAVLGYYDDWATRLPDATAGQEDAA